MSESKYKKRLERMISDKQGEEDARNLEFLKSLQGSLEKWGSLTAKQVAALERIEKLSTPEAKKEAAQWIKEYPSKHRSTATICAKYYLANPPYFSDISKQIMQNPDFVPTKSQFDALTKNPYTTKILEEYHRQPAYDKGDLVQIRSASSVPFYLSSVKSPCVVIDNNHDFITTHAKGAKTYKLLPIGKKVTLLCQERWIKNFRNKTKKGK